MSDQAPLARAPDAAPPSKADAEKYVRDVATYVQSELIQAQNSLTDASTLGLMMSEVMAKGRPIGRPHRLAEIDICDMGSKVGRERLERIAIMHSMRGKSLAWARAGARNAMQTAREAVEYAEAMEFIQNYQPPEQAAAAAEAAAVDDPALAAALAATRERASKLARRRKRAAIKEGTKILDETAKEESALGGDEAAA